MDLYKPDAAIQIAETALNYPKDELARRVYEYVTQGKLPDKKPLVGASETSAEQIYRLNNFGYEEWLAAWREIGLEVHHDLEKGILEIGPIQRRKSND